MWIGSTNAPQQSPHRNISATTVDRKVGMAVDQGLYYERHDLLATRIQVWEWKCAPVPP